MRKLLNSIPFLIFILILIILYFVLNSSTRNNNELANLELLSIAGERLDLKKLKGQAFVLHFFASWCGMCKHDLPFLQQIKGNKNNLIIGIAINDHPSRISQLDTKALPYNFIAFDEEKKAAKFLFARVIPQTIVVNKHSKIVLHHIGGIDAQVMKQMLYHLNDQDL